jgi:DNA-binding HxlR family transcriptional regulator
LIVSSYMEKEIAECIGLWLAEGDNKTVREITLTNNSIDVILFFHEYMMKIYNGKNVPRIYVYSPCRRKLYNSIGGIKTNFYTDERANRPYYIYRIADVSFLREWRVIANKMKNRKKLIEHILRGFFAGEGNVKFDQMYGTRAIRISQGKRNDFLESMLKKFDLKFQYDNKKRMYWITSRRNLLKLKELDIASLNPVKYAEFIRMMRSYSNISKSQLKREIYSKLMVPTKFNKLSSDLKANWVDTSLVLSELKKEGRIGFFRENREIYWARKAIVGKVLLKRKTDIISNLNIPKGVGRISKCTNIPRKTIARRLKELEREEFIERTERSNRCSKWRKTKNGENFMTTILGIDEAGNRLRNS